MRLASLAPSLNQTRNFGHGATKIGGYVLVGLLGFAAGNAHVTRDALEGSKTYFVHEYCPKLASKVAAKAAAKAVLADRAQRPVVVVPVPE